MFNPNAKPTTPGMGHTMLGAPTALHLPLPSHGAPLGVPPPAGRVGGRVRAPLSISCAPRGMPIEARAMTPAEIAARQEEQRQMRLTQLHALAPNELREHCRAGELIEECQRRGIPIPPPCDLIPYNFTPEPPGRLYLGGVDDVPAMTRYLLDNGPTARTRISIFNMASSYPYIEGFENFLTVNNHRIRYHAFDWPDSSNFSLFERGDILSVLCLLHNELLSRDVIIHCQAGISRSVSVVAAYLMRQSGLNFNTCLSHIRRYRYKAEPNFGFGCELGARFGSGVDGSDSERSYDGAHAKVRTRLQMPLVLYTGAR